MAVAGAGAGAGAEFICTKSEPEPKINNFGSASLEKNMNFLLLMALDP